MNSLIAPKPLQKGDIVGIVALAGKLNIDDIKPAIEILEKVWEVKVIIGKSVESAYYIFAGTDEIRASDFQEMLDNQGVKAIFSARGGYGSSRFIDKIDFSEFQQNPKWIIGFSDITAVHGRIQNLGFQSLHAPMPKTFLKDAHSLNCLQKILFGESLIYEIPAHAMNRVDKGLGQIVGGNLCLIAHCIGSVSELDTANRILFIEDVGEKLYNIDRMMVQLKRANKLEKLSGLIVGDFSDCEDDEADPFGKNAYEIIAEHIADYTFPVAYGFPIGHEAINYPIACGSLVELTVTDAYVKLAFSKPHPNVERPNPSPTRRRA